MEPKILKKGEIKLVGMNFYGDPFKVAGEWSEENAIGQLWQRFMAYLEKQGELLKHKVEGAMYEVHVQTKETYESGNFAVFVGIEVEKFDDVPVDLIVKILPPTQYAVFTLKGEEIVSDWPQKIYKEWLPNSDYENAYNFQFQYYDERWKGFENPETEIDVYVPVK